ncbi:pmpB, partial [Symbiodinium sp. CCMP2456]
MRSRDLRARLLALALATLVAVEAEAPPPPGDAFASRPGPEFQPELQLEACEAVGAEKLVDWCRGELLLPGCFRVESVPDELPASCQLRGPNATGEAASLLGNGQSLVGGEIFLTGQLRLESLRLQLTGSLTLEDAQVLMSGNETTEEGGAFSAGSVATIRRSNLTVLMSHNQTSEVEHGGAFSAGTVTLRRSSLTVEGTTRAQVGGGFYADNLTLSQGSNLSISGSSASGDGGGFFVNGSAVVDGSSISLRDTHATVDAGGFGVMLGLQLKDGASLWISDCSAGRDGGGFISMGDLRLQDSMLHIQNVSAGRMCGALCVEDKMMLEASNLTVEGTSAVSFGSFMAGETKLLHSNLQIIDSRAGEDLPAQDSILNEMVGFVGGFLIHGGLTLDASSMTLLHVRGRMIGGFSVPDGLELKGSRVTVQHAHATQDYGAVSSLGAILISEGSSLHVSDCFARGSSAGVFAKGSMRITGGSTVRIQRVSSAVASGVFAWGDVVLTGGSLLQIAHAFASGSAELFGDCGGLLTLGLLQVLSSSAVRIEHARALDSAGGFRAQAVVIADGSLLLLRNTSAEGSGGGFYASGAVKVSNSSNISIQDATAGIDGGGFVGIGGLQVSSRSVIEISDTTSEDQGGGFTTSGFVMVTGGSRIRISNARAVSLGGGFFAKGNVTIAKGSELLIDGATAGRDGGGFQASKVEVYDQSLLSISGARAHGDGGAFAAASFAVWDSSLIIRDSAADFGGGFHSMGDVLISRSSLHLARCRAAGEGGGFNAQATLRVIENSTVDLQDVTAARGGGFVCLGRVEIHASSLEVAGAAAEMKSGGGFQADTLVVNASRLRISNSTARKSGGGFLAQDVILTASEATFADVAAGGDGAGFNAQANLRIEDSAVSIRNANASRVGGGFKTMFATYLRKAELRIVQAVAGKGGGCFNTHKLELSDAMLEASECVAHVNGGGFHADDVTLSRAQVRISGSALERGGGFFAQKLEAWNSELWVAGLDSMAQPAKPGADAVLGSGAFVGGPLRLANSAVHLHNLWGKSALASRCLLLNQSTLSLDAATEVGISVQNALCSCHATHVAGVDFPSLRLEGALVGMGVSSALLSVEPCGNETLEIAHVHFRRSQAAVAKTTAHTRLRNITVEYLEAIHEIQLLTAPSFEAETVQVSCPACAQGVTFASAIAGLRAVSPPSLHCEKTALLNGTTARCGCFFPQQVPDKHYGDDVEVSETGSYCMYCPSHFQARGEDCEKCPLHKAWSEGTGDPCVALPVQAELWLLLLLAAVVFVLLAATAFEVLWAPLAVVDAHTLEGEGLLVTVQGPVCHLPKLLVNYIRSEVSYDFHGTGFSWLDSKKTTGKVKSLRRCKLQLPLQPEQPPYTCATSKGFLRVNSGYKKMLLQFWILLCLLLLVPTVLVVASLSKNGPWHVLVTGGYFVLPLV